MRANLSVYEPQTPQDSDSPLAFSMEGHGGPNDSATVVPFAWAPGWNSPQAWTKFQDEVGGKLRSGDSGVRLLEPKDGQQVKYAAEIPPPFVKQGDKWRLAPLYHIFGSDELSALAPAAEGIITTAYVALATEDAKQLQVVENSTLTVTFGSRGYSLRVHIDDALTPGLVGLPMGLPGMPSVLGHTFATLSVGGLS
jgi:NADH-quinone oxidoreductase subunit G